jgi:hypothetical protein
MLIFIVKEPMRNLLFCLIAILPILIFCQNKNNSKYHYKWFDNTIGLESTNLLNGIYFQEKYRTLEGNSQYLVSKQFKNGDLVYNGQPYYDVSLKYDVFNDEIIVSYIDRNGYSAIKLAKNLIHRFKINNHSFINSNQLDIKTNNTNNTGFYESIFIENNIALYKKHKKNRQDKRNKEVAYTEFKYKSTYIIHYKKEIHELVSKRSLLKLFPNFKKTINNSFTKNKTLMKYDYEKFLTKLIKELSLNLKSDC